MGRPKGKGTLIKRGRIYHAIWKVNGRVIKVSTGETDEKAALAFLEREGEVFRLSAHTERLQLIQRRIEDDADRLRRLERIANALPLSRLADTYIASPRRPDSSAEMLRFYRRVIDRLITTLGDVDACSIDDAAADLHATALGRDVGAGTYNKHINGLALVWRVLGRSAGLPSNPWAEMPRKRSDAHIRRPVTAQEVERILDAASGEMRKVIAVSAFTGLRMGDACNLRWTSIGDGIVRVKTAKTGAEVAIPLHPRLAAILGKRRSVGLVCPDIAAIYNRDPSLVTRRAEAVFRAAGLTTSVFKGGRRRPDCTFHSLRHFFVSHSIECGVPAPIVKELVGHSAYAMTERYTHISAEKFATAFGMITESQTTKGE